MDEVVTVVAAPAPAVVGVTLNPDSVADVPVHIVTVNVPLVVTVTELAPTTSLFGDPVATPVPFAIVPAPTTAYFVAICYL